MPTPSSGRDRNVQALVPRHTIFAIVSAIETDLRNLIEAHLGPQLTPAALLGEDLWQKVVDRLEAEQGTLDETPSLKDLLPFLDFAETWQVLNSRRALVPAPVSTYIRRTTSDLESLVPIRNRIAHTRPLALDDFGTATALAERFVEERPDLWLELKGTVERLRDDPSFVLGLMLPTPTAESGHNLPIPDFEETGFVGRAGLIAELTRHLVGGAYPVITLKGEGGIGKTALALHVAYAVLDDEACPFDAVVWTTAKSTQLTPAGITEIRGAVRDSLGLVGLAAEKLAGAAAAEPFQEVLEYMGEFRILLVLDNLETVLDQRLRSFVSCVPQGSKVLITSRVALGAYDFPVDVGPLSDGEALQLIRQTARVRGVPGLVAMPNEQLLRLCRQMHNSPGFMQWFVAAVRAGQRPEDVLAAPDEFLDFCMSNVYGFVQEEGRNVLDILQCVPESASQAEIAFLADMQAADLQPALGELMASNMVRFSPQVLGGGFESSYELSGLARKYLARHHPPSANVVAAVGARRSSLADIETRAGGSDPYDDRFLDLRADADLAVARLLSRALESIERNDPDGAVVDVDEAKRLAPGWHEVRRVEAAVEVARSSQLAARQAFEAALELAPESAPLRLRFGEFLLHRLDDSVGAARQFRIGLDFDPEAPRLSIGLARAELANARPEAARDVLAPLHRSAVPSLSLPLARRAADLLVRAYAAVIEARVSQDQLDDAVTELHLLVQDLGVVQDETLGAGARDSLARCRDCAEACSQRLDAPRSDEAARIAVQLGDVLAASGVVALPVSAGGRPMASGTITGLVKHQGFGYVQGSEGPEQFFEYSALTNGLEDSDLEVGLPVCFASDVDDDANMRAVELAPLD